MQTSKEDPELGQGSIENHPIPLHARESLIQTMSAQLKAILRDPMPFLMMFWDTKDTQGFFAAKTCSSLTAENHN